MCSEIEIKDASIDGVKIITPFYEEDCRGYLLKSIERETFKKFNLDIDICEVYESYSRQDVIRGLHFQLKNPQIKIVRAVTGTVYDVIVDLRKDSPTFGKHIGMELSEKNRLCLWIPAGFAHGFKVISKDAIMSYKCIGKYLKGHDIGIRWNDPDLGIEWDIDNPVVSDKDKLLPSFREFVMNYSGL